MTTTEELLSALRKLGVAKASELAKELGISQPVLSRLITAAGPRVCRMGRARATRYALARELPGVGARLPVYRISEAGEVAEFGTLCVLDVANRYWLDHADGSGQLFQGLPTFAQDMAPQGYLGRGLARRCPDLGLPAHINDWNDDHRLIAIARRGEDCVGNLIVGAESLDRFLANETREASREAYPRLARESAQGQPGSSAGGEQPKFLAFVDGRHVLVKFADGDGAADQRWRDLLACEALALDVLRRAGIPAAEANCHDIGPGRYLEVVRFDRVGRRGRRGVVSLTALNNQYLSADYSWPKAAASLREEPSLDIDAEDCRRMVWLDTFGELIANTDRHFGNLSFLTEEHSGRLRLRLAPAYDMLPMLFAPVAAVVVSRPFEPRPPTSENYTLWASAARAAREFWGEASALETVSDEFRRTCEACGGVVAELMRRQGMG
jgi:hypothetical protein